MGRIGTTGGTLQSADGKLSLQFPAGALARDTEIHIATDRSTIRGDLSGAIYHFSPDGTQFAKGVTVKIGVSVLPPEGEDYFVANTDQAEPALLEDSVFDESTMSVTASLQHFSSYGLFHRPGRCRNKACGESCGSVAGTPLACNVRHRCVPAAVALPSCSIGGVDGGPFFGDIGLVDAVVFVDAGGPDAGALDAGPFFGDGGFLGDGGTGFLLVGEAEPNDTFPQAIPLFVGNGVTVQANLGSGDTDLYSFQVPPGALVSFRGVTHTDPNALGACDGGLDTVLTLLDARGVVLAENDDFNRGCSEINGSKDFGAAFLGEGTYTVSVRSFQAIAGIQYFLSMELTNAEALDGGVSGFDVGPIFDGGIFGSDGGIFGSDGGIFGSDGGIPGFDGGPAPDGGILVSDAGSSSSFSETEPNDDISSADLFGTGQLPAQAVIDGAMGTGTDVDTFGFSETASFNLDANVSCTGFDPILFLLDSSGRVLAQNDDASTQNPCPHLVVNGLAPGDYFLQIRAFATGLGTYRIDTQIR